MKYNDVIIRAIQVLLSRGEDVSTNNGDFATVDCDYLLILEEEIVKAFDLPDDDVKDSDVEIIISKLTNHKP